MAISTKQSSPRIDRGAPRAGEHAIVIGASIAGLLAARVLADAYDRVTVLDRDRLPDGVTENRRAVPQGRHAHGLQLGGQEALEDLLPGFRADTMSEGAPALQPGVEMRFTLAGNAIVRTPVGTEGSVASRPLIEGIVRRRVRAIENVTVIDDCGVDELLHADGRITGVRARDRAAGSTAIDLPADLVVAASGRGGRVPKWLEAMGYERPAEERVDVDIMYASRNLRIRPGALGEDKIILDAAHPGRPRGVAMLADEHGTWNVTLYGYGAAHRPPTDADGFNAFAATVCDPDVAAAIAQAEPANEIVTHGYPASLRRRYDKLRRFPEGLVVTGDALCSFNPIYGQGMTVATLEAVALRDCLRGGSHKLATRFFKAAHGPVDHAWKLSTGGDLALPEIEQTAPLPDRVINRYMERLVAVAGHDEVVARTFFEVTGMLKPPTALLAPAMVRRVLRRGAARPVRLTTRTAPLTTGAEAGATS
jgi:2-polyprenyl-6-methoxyphenol hydroxylase-like FAD-dependent oxidoreductase